MRKRPMWFPNGPDTNRAVHAKKIARGWKFWMKKVKQLYYLCCENKGADQLRSCCEADLHFAFAYAKCWFSHDAPHMHALHDSNMPKIFSWQFYYWRTRFYESIFIMCIKKDSMI